MLKKIKNQACVSVINTLSLCFISENNLNYFKAKPILMGMPNTPIPTGFSLTKNYYPSKRAIAINISKILNKKVAAYPSTLV